MVQMKLMRRCKPTICLHWCNVAWMLRLTSVLQNLCYMLEGGFQLVIDTYMGQSWTYPTLLFGSIRPLSYPFKGEIFNNGFFPHVGQSPSVFLFSFHSGIGRAVQDPQPKSNTSSQHSGQNFVMPSAGPEGAELDTNIQRTAKIICVMPRPFRTCTRPKTA